MLREVALRRALQHARDRRAEELEEVVARSRILRRRMRELTDRHLALGTVHARFFVERAIEEPKVPASAEPTRLLISEPPVPPPSLAPEVSPPEPHPEPVVIRAAPTPKKEELHTRVLPALRERYPDGFTVGQMREVLEEIEGRSHSYDFAWTLANTLARSRVLEIAGTKPGPAAPIRIFRVPRPGVAATEAA